MATAARAGASSSSPTRRSAERVLAKHFRAEGRGGKPYGNLHKWTIDPRTDRQRASLAELQELAVASAFAEVMRAKHHHDGVVGINVLRKIALPIPATIYGAMLAGVDVVLTGAGSPDEMPRLLDALARHDEGLLSVKVMRAAPGAEYATRFAPAEGPRAPDRRAAEAATVPRDRRLGRPGGRPRLTARHVPGWVRRGGPDRRGPQRAAAWPVAPPVRPFLRRARQRRPGGHRGDRPALLARRLVRKRGRAARSARRGRARHTGRHGVRPEPGVWTDLRAQEPGPRQGRRRHPHRDHRRKRVSDRAFPSRSISSRARSPTRPCATHASADATSATCASP